MSDGCRLAARLFLPEDADTVPVPAVFEYIPYRRRDFTRARDEVIHPYFAGSGYASLRVDMRGSGDSDGILRDEYLDQEHEDALEVIEWIAAQPWCDGSVGMFGKSWGGINALQTAAYGPSRLKCILSVCSTDNIYLDPDHYLGGCLTDVQMIWGSLFVAFQRCPPDPDVVGERWRELWKQRLASNIQPMESWFRHQRYDSFWKRESVSENLAAIDCPVYLVGGWLDGFSNPIFRMLRGLTCPRKGLVGPWGHHFPHEGWPGPSIGFLQEAVRWWDHWLKGRDTGIMKEAMLRVWMQESVSPDPEAAERPGRWVAVPSWPSPQIKSQSYALNSTGLGATGEKEDVMKISSPQTVGLGGPVWSYAEHQAQDQRQDDAGSLCFDSDELSEGLEILGAPVVTLAFSSNRPVAILAVRLCDLAPDGSSLFVSHGILNLTRRDSHERPAPLEPGKRYQISFQLDEIAHSFAAGHRIRLALSTSYWHRVWPAPEPATVTLFTGTSTLELPGLPPQTEGSEVRPFGEPEGAAPMRKTVLRPGRRESSLSRNTAGHEWVMTRLVDQGLFRIEDHGLELEHVALDRFSIREDDPLSATFSGKRTFVFQRKDWKVRIESSVILTCSATTFHLRSRLDAYEGALLVDSKQWDSSFPRDLL